MMQIKVAGMTCAHCVAAVSQAVRAVPNVASVAVDLGGGLVTVTGAADAQAVRHAITDEGYEVLETAPAEDRGDLGKVLFRRVGC